MLTQTKPVSVRKLFVEAKGPEHKEYRIGIVDLSCTSTWRPGMIYVRGLASDEAGKGQIVRFVVDGKEMPMSAITSSAKLDFLDTGSSFDHWGRYDARDFLEQAAKVDNFSIAAGPLGKPLDVARATKLSTAGLASALGTLRETCALADQPEKAQRP